MVFLFFVSKCVFSKVKSLFRKVVVFLVIRKNLSAEKYFQDSCNYQPVFQKKAPDDKKSLCIFAKETTKYPEETNEAMVFVRFVLVFKFFFSQYLEDSFWP